MIAAVVLMRETALRIDRTAKLATPDHQGFIEESARLQVLNQSPARLVNVLALARQSSGDVGVVVPVVVVDLDEPHAPLDHSPGEECRVSKST